MRGVTAYDISCLMEYKGLNLKEASEESILNRLTDLGGDGGVISIDKDGHISMPFNCEGMYRGFRTLKETYIGIYK